MRFNIFASLSSADLTMMSEAIHEGQHLRWKQINLEIKTWILFLLLSFLRYFYMFSSVFCFRTYFEEVKCHIIACTQMSVGKHQMFLFNHFTHIYFFITTVIYLLFQGNAFGSLMSCHTSNISSWKYQRKGHLWHGPWHSDRRNNLFKAKRYHLTH